ncbi:MAG: hypothetical protein R3Y60_01600 [bacterium]
MDNNVNNTKTLENEYELMKNVLSLQNKLTDLQVILNDIFAALTSSNIDDVKLILINELQKNEQLINSYADFTGRYVEHNSLKYENKNIDYLKDDLRIIRNIITFDKITKYGLEKLLDFGINKIVDSIR